MHGYTEETWNEMKPECASIGRLPHATMDVVRVIRVLQYFCVLQLLLAQQIIKRYKT
jgi:hypothetical protein